MTNDDLKRFFPQNGTPEKKEDFVRYTKDGLIPGLNAEGAESGIAELTSVTDIGDAVVTYDTTDGMTINTVERYTYGEDGTTKDVNTEREIPIKPGVGINIDATEDGTAIEISADSAKFKTLFGNHSVVGEGNIDLFDHDISIVGTNVEAYLDVYSSINTKVDSLTDLKTLLGATFTRGCYGVAGGKSVYAITESALKLADGTIQTLAGLTFDDIVTTI